ncbi:MAG: dienelactone hydrolase family protein [Vulcanimicrobiaceae bacterium]
MKHTVTVDDSPMDMYVARPDDATTAFPAMLVFQEAFGVNAHIRDVTDRFAHLGFTAIAPELFHRTGRGVEGSYTDFAALAPHFGALTRAGLEADIDAAYAWLKADAAIDASRVAAIGFCMGGRVAYLANARVPLKGAISFYGGGIAPDLLSLANDQHAPLLMFWGGLDGRILPEHYHAVAAALTDARKIHEQVIFSQADHGFFCDARASYNAAAASQAWALTQAFLHAYEAY